MCQSVDKWSEFTYVYISLHIESFASGQLIKFMKLLAFKSEQIRALWFWTLQLQAHYPDCLLKNDARMI